MIIFQINTCDFARKLLYYILNAHFDLIMKRICRHERVVWLKKLTFHFKLFRDKLIRIYHLVLRPDHLVLRYAFRIQFTKKTIVLGRPIDLKSNDNKTWVFYCRSKRIWRKQCSLPSKRLKMPKSQVFRLLLAWCRKRPQSLQDFEHLHVSRKHPVCGQWRHPCLCVKNRFFK